MNVANMDDYREPFQTYKRILSKNAGGEQTERTMLFKGSALEKQGAIKDAVANYLDMFNRFPKGKYREEAGKRLKNIALMLFDAYYAKGDHLAVADLYFKVNGKIILTDDFDIAFKTGQSLQRLGFYEEAGGLYSALKEVKKSNREITSRLTLALAHMDVMKKKYGEAEEKVQLLLREEKDRKNDTTIKQTLADIYYRQGSFEKAVEFYADALGHEKGERQTAAYMNYARSLQNRQMTQAAQKNYLGVYKDYQLHPDKYDTTDIVDMFVGMGDGHCNEKKFKEGIMMYRQALSLVSDIDSKKWLLFKIGQGYAYLRDFDEAENSFAQIKEGKAGDFWIKIADLYIAENRRMERNEVRR
jgi:tetratricopeptide (TPR) repeat protein